MHKTGPNSLLQAEACLPHRDQAKAAGCVMTLHSVAVLSQEPAAKFSPLQTSEVCDDPKQKCTAEVRRHLPQEGQTAAATTCIRSLVP